MTQLWGVTSLVCLFSLAALWLLDAFKGNDLVNSTAAATFLAALLGGGLIGLGYVIHRIYGECPWCEKE